jgi:hypothetical protein
MAAAARAERVAAAEREVEISRQRLLETRENVVEPLRAAAAHNSFAEIIAASLRQGRGNGAAR